MDKRIKEIASDLSKAVIQDYGGVYFLETAKELYDLGYRKIPEGAVVLTPAERDEEMRLIREDVIQRMEATRKETAEKIAHAIEALLKERFIGLTLRQHLQRKGMEEGLKMALEIAKEITEGSNG